jgi:fermentation-respiration switch protein FrsA (DUF1100 family)
VAMSTNREKVRFASGDTECAAWHYPGSNGACVVMAGGFAVTKEPATDMFAKRFCEAGFAVLAFDYRRLGESGGLPRQVVRVREQLADWQAAIGFAATLPGVDPARLAVWGFSASGGRCPLGAPHRALPARPLCVPGALPAAGRRLRRGSVRTCRSRRQRGAASAPGRAGSPRRRALCTVPGWSRAGRRGRAVLPARAPARSGARGLARRRGFRAAPGRPDMKGMKQIELSAGTKLPG